MQKSSQSSTSSRHRELKLSTTPFSHGQPGSMKSGLIPFPSRQRRTSWATYSGPLSLRICSGIPTSPNNFSKCRTTSFEVILGATTRAKQRLVYSSKIGMIFNRCPYRSFFCYWKERYKRFSRKCNPHRL